MLKPKTYSIKEIHESTYLSFESSFYTNKDINFILSELQNITNKNIQLTNIDSIQPSYTSLVLLKEYESKKPLYKIKSSFYNYNEYDSILKNICKWISENCTTDYTTNLKVGLSFNSNILESLTSINNMNIKKLLLKVNEKYIYSKFPNFKDSPFSMSIKKLVPINYSFNSNILSNINNSFSAPIGENYAIDFTKQIHGILYFNYIGGKKYANDYVEINEIINYLIAETFNSLNENFYTNDEIKEINLLTEKYKKYINAYYNVNSFLKEFKNIKVSVNLNDNEETIKTYWPSIRNHLFNLVTECGVISGFYNFDSETGTHELKKCKLINCNLKGYNLLSVEGNGVFENCEMINCKITKGNISKCKLYTGNQIKDSYLKNTSAHKQSILEKCFVKNNEEVINCQIKESIIMFGLIGNGASIDENSTVIENPKLGLIDNKRTKEKINNGLGVHEIKDIEWIKKLDKQINPKKIRYN